MGAPILPAPCMAMRTGPDVFHDAGRYVYTVIGRSAGKYSLVASVPNQSTIIVYTPVQNKYSKDLADTMAKNLGMSRGVGETQNTYFANDADAKDNYFVVQKRCFGYFIPEI